jgi:hypothetical protein
MGFRIPKIFSLETAERKSHGDTACARSRQVRRETKEEAEDGVVSRSYGAGRICVCECGQVARL